MGVDSSRGIRQLIFDNKYLITRHGRSMSMYSEGGGDWDDEEGEEEEGDDSVFTFCFSIKKELSSYCFLLINRLLHLSLRKSEFHVVMINVLKYRCQGRPSCTLRT